MLSMGKGGTRVSSLTQGFTAGGTVGSNNACVGLDPDPTDWARSGFGVGGGGGSAAAEATCFGSENMIDIEDGKDVVDVRSGISSLGSKVGGKLGSWGSGPSGGGSRNTKNSGWFGGWFSSGGNNNRNSSDASNGNGNTNSIDSTAGLDRPIDVTFRTSI
jgi:hypothetical protein